MFLPSAVKSSTSAKASSLSTVTASTQTTEAIIIKTKAKVGCMIRTAKNTSEHTANTPTLLSIYVLSTTLSNTRTVWSMTLSMLNFLIFNLNIAVLAAIFSKAPDQYMNIKENTTTKNNAKYSNIMKSVARSGALTM